MAFQIVILLLILAIVAFYALEGLYSATVMAVCTIVSVVLAINFFEPVAASMRGAMPRFADAIALGLAFAVPLVALRLAADRLLGGMVHIPLLIDRIGGGLLGIVSALIVIGVFTLCVRLMPFGPSIMGYKQVASIGPTGQINVEPLWLRPDGFVLGLAENLSVGPLSAGKRFSAVHPDYIAELAGFNHFASETAEPFSNDALSPVTGTGIDGKTRTASGGLGEYVPADSVPTELNISDAVRGRVDFFGVRVLPKVANGESGIVLTATQAQLTCRKQGTGEDRPMIVLAPLWLVDWSSTWRGPFPVTSAWRDKIEKKRTGIIGLGYAVPKDYDPVYLTVRKNTRVELTIVPGPRDGSKPANPE